LVVRWFVAALLLPTLFFGNVAGASALLRCKVTQSVHATCCCPVTPELSHDSVTRSCCCERVEVETSLPSGNLGGDAQVAAYGPAVLAVSKLVFGTPPSLAAAAYAPPTWVRKTIRARAGPSLVILHSRFLI
jgi:hypothetical protein